MLKQSLFGCKTSRKIKISLLFWHSVKVTNPFEELKPLPYHHIMNTFYRCDYVNTSIRVNSQFAENLGRAWCRRGPARQNTNAYVAS